MSVLFGRKSRSFEFPGATASDLIGRRGYTRTGSVAVTSDSALRASAVWACLRLRADLISTMPVDSFRRLPDGTQIETAKPPLLVQPGGERVHITEWLYSSQFELDRSGNAFGLITARDGTGLPARIDLVPSGEVSVRGSGAEIAEYRIGQKWYSPEHVWHERQFTLPGVALGMSPVAYGAWSVGGYLSAQQFALDWFASDVSPSGTLRHTTQDTINPAVADVMKDRFKVAVSQRDLFVTGSDWEYTPGAADASATAFLEQMEYGVTDICRFFGVPADMVDGAVSKSSVTYANITQRNLQLLVMNLGPAIIRREVALSNAMSRPRYAKFNTDALLRMDPAARIESIKTQIESRQIAPSEARELDNRQPFTEEQLAEFDRLFGKGAQAPIQVTKAAERSSDAPVVHVHTTVEPSTAVTESAARSEELLSQIAERVAVDAPSPTVIVNVEPTPLTVEVAAPQVTVESAQNIVNVEPTPLTVEVAAPTVQVEAPAVTVVVPEEKAKTSKTTVKRDRNGLITSTETTES